MKKYTYSNGGVPRDAYFTPRDTAFKIVEYLLEQYPHWQEKEWFEPSAGAGVFLDAAHEHGIKVSGVDIHPMREDVEKMDFLEEDIDLTGKVVFGNPPFGVKNYLSIKFINRAFDLGAEHVAFLLGGGILGSQNLMRVPYIEHIKAVENRFESGENKRIKISPNTALVVFSRKEQTADWKKLYTGPYIESVYLRDAVDSNHVFSSGYNGTFGELKTLSSYYGKHIQPGRGELYTWVEFIIGGKKGVGMLYNLKSGFCFDTFKKLSKLSSIGFRPSPRTMNYWLNPENKQRIDFTVL